MTVQNQIAVRQPPAPLRLSRGGFAALAVAYGLVVVYSSLFLGPDGLRFDPMSAAEAWRRFTATRLVANASDQRADWIANAILMIPFAYLVSGALRTQGARRTKLDHAPLSFAVSLAFVLAVKYLQLFFPPRTVTLNYIAAQSIGAALGVWLFQLTRRQLWPAMQATYRGGNGLALVLGGYSVLLIADILMPFDIAFSPGDLAARFERITFAIFPAPGHDLTYRAALIVIDTLAVAPLGMFLAVTDREQSFGTLLLRGVAIIVPATVVSLFVMSVEPVAFSLVTRIAGVALGVRFILWLKGKDLWKRHYRFAGYVPVVLPLYIALLVWANGLLAGAWLAPDTAFAALDPRRLLPLWGFYIDTKLAAAQSVVATVAMYAPLGALIWVKRGFWSKGAGFSAFLAFVLAMAVEICRTMKPALVPDFNAPFIAAFAAATMFRSMPALWRLFEQEAKASALADTYESKVVRAGRLFGSIELLPRRRATAAPDPADALAAAQARIADLERQVRALEGELDFYRLTGRKSGR